MINFVAYSNQFNCGVSCSLNHVLYVRDNERFGGGVPDATSSFSAFMEEDDGGASPGSDSVTEVDADGMFG
jgi:hypothetical protein